MHKYRVVEKILFWPTYLNVEKLKSKLEQKTILITGASSGIGEQLAYMLADIDVHMILVARNEYKLIEMKNEIENSAARVSILAADLRDNEQMDKLTAFILHLSKGLDIVVNNAGKSINRSINASLNRYHDFTRTMAINYFAPVQLLLTAIPILEKNHGHIINISTINALLLPIPYWAAYQASKSAFDVWFRSAAPELNSMGISTTTLYLPLVKTPMIEPNKAYDKMPAMCPNHVAKIICKAMYTNKKYYKPWWLFFIEFNMLLFRWLWELFAPYSIIFSSRKKRG